MLRKEAALWWEIETGILSGFGGCGRKDNSKLTDNLKNKNRITHDPEFSLLGVYPKRKKELVQKYRIAPVLTETLFTIVKILKTSLCSFVS